MVAARNSTANLIMAAPKGNRYWEMRDKHGRDYAYTPEALWEEAIKYFQWVEENPLWEEKPFAYQGEITIGRVAKMRAMTIGGFCLFADISKETLFSYRNNKDFIDVITRIEENIREQKFTGAAAELLNPNIIARDLGLKDGIDHSTLGSKITAPEFDLSKLTPEELKQYAEIQRKLERH